jgi:hypothetical protein
MQCRFKMEYRLFTIVLVRYNYRDYNICSTYIIISLIPVIYWFICFEETKNLDGHGCPPPSTLPLHFLLFPSSPSQTKFPPNTDFIFLHCNWFEFVFLFLVYLFLFFNYLPFFWSVALFSCLVSVLCFLVWK